MTTADRIRQAAADMLQALHDAERNGEKLEDVLNEVCDGGMILASLGEATKPMSEAAIYRSTQLLNLLALGTAYQITDSFGETIELVEDDMRELQVAMAPGICEDDEEGDAVPSGDVAEAFLESLNRTGTVH